MDHVDTEYPSVASNDAEPDEVLDVVPESEPSVVSQPVAEPAVVVAPQPLPEPTPSALLPQPVDNTPVAVAPPTVGSPMSYLDVARTAVDVRPSDVCPSVPAAPKKFQSRIVLTEAAASPRSGGANVSLHSGGASVTQTCPATESIAGPHSGGASTSPLSGGASVIDGEWIEVDTRCRSHDRTVQGFLVKVDPRHSDWYLSPSLRQTCDVINLACRTALIRGMNQLNLQSDLPALVKCVVI